MNLKDMYYKGKKPSEHWTFKLGEVLGFVLLVGFVYLMSLVWNYVAPIWGLPVLNFIQFIASLALIDIFLLQFLALKGVKKDNQRQNIQLVQLPNVEDFPNELQ